MFASMLKQPGKTSLLDQMRNELPGIPLAEPEHGRTAQTIELSGIYKNTYSFPVILLLINGTLFRRKSDRKYIKFIKEQTYFYICRQMRTKDTNKELAIRQKTMELVVKEGLEGFSMHKLADSAGISVNTIYLNFKNKEDLV